MEASHKTRIAKKTKKKSWTQRDSNPHLSKGPCQLLPSFAIGVATNGTARQYSLVSSNMDLPSLQPSAFPLDHMPLR